ncbi:hypothetical protein ACVGVM_16365 [Pseudonocardia bannensis]|uniref:Uncharacterized protein n=1 Tax=Pseudonocardia bannensis TaxID=630973 RepID=A0A848DMC9_9PSEU|nr:hypothetical protein [Pseudonocardia bannensis]NMH93882.1 hypothetical protein [Pseudonocardia bannensis]
MASGPLWLALLTVLALVITLLLVLARSHTSLTDRTAAVGPGTGATTGAVGSAPTGTEGAGSGTGDGGPAPGGGSVPGATGDRAPGGGQGHGDRRGPAGDPAFPAPATPPATPTPATPTPATPPPAAPAPGPPRGVNAGSGGDTATDPVGGPSPVLVLGASAVVVVTLIAVLRIRRGPAGGPDTRPPGT